MSRSQIEQRYGVPLPIDVLWSLIEAEIGPEKTSDLRVAYQQATKRYGRASDLNKYRRLVSYWERREPGHPRLADWRAILANPQAYIDRK